MNNRDILPCVNALGESDVLKAPACWWCFWDDVCNPSLWRRRCVNSGSKNKRLLWSRPRQIKFIRSGFEHLVLQIKTKLHASEVYWRLKTPGEFLLPTFDLNWDLSKTVYHLPIAPGFTRLKLELSRGPKEAQGCSTCNKRPNKISAGIDLVFLSSFF